MAASKIQDFFRKLTALPFVRGVSLLPAPDDRFDGILKLRTEDGTFQLFLVERRSYLEKASTNAIVALAQFLKRKGHDLLLLARYIPRPTGERLAAADVNFVDSVGNIHLALGKKFARTILGRPEEQKRDTARLVTAAQIQTLFLFAATPEALRWPVRDIAEHAGISKSKAAEVKQQFEKTQNAKPDPDLLLKGYAQVLRPKLVLGRFRSPDLKGEDLVARLIADLPHTETGFALTGGPASELLQHFYRGEETPLFFRHWNSEIQQRFRLLPDRQGPITILRAFGDPCFWRQIKKVTIAHPWLIYAELLHSEDTRAHEAAENLRREFLES